MRIQFKDIKLWAVWNYQEFPTKGITKCMLFNDERQGEPELVVTSEIKKYATAPHNKIEARYWSLERALLNSTFTGDEIVGLWENYLENRRQPKVQGPRVKQPYVRQAL